MTQPSREDILAVIRKRHGLANDAPVQLKSVPVAVKMEDGDPYQFTPRITSDTLDRDDEVLLPMGMDPTEFEKSGAIFYNHDYSQPVGFPGKLRKGKDGDRQFIEAPGSKFMRKPDDWGDAAFPPDYARAYVTQAIEAGVLPGISVGFIGDASRAPTKKDKADFGERVKRVWTRWRLLEFSIAPVQSNTDSFVTVMGKSLGVFKPVAPVQVESPKRKIYVMEIPDPPKVRVARSRPRAKIDVGAMVARTMAKARGCLYT